jgi:hypothetical protein
VNPYLRWPWRVIHCPTGKQSRYCTAERCLPPWRKNLPSTASGSSNIHSALLHTTPSHINARSCALANAIHKQAVCPDVIHFLPSHLHHVKPVESHFVHPRLRLRQGARVRTQQEEQQQQPVSSGKQTGPKVPSLEHGCVREAGGGQHLDGSLVRRAGAEVELQNLRSVGQAEDAPAELQDHCDEGGGAGKPVLRPIGVGVGAWAGEGEGEEGVLGVEDENVRRR